MGPITYSLCQKPVLGLLMYLASACAFPPLFDEQAFPLQQQGARMVREFEAPVDKTYFLALNFHGEGRRGMHVDDIAGTYPYQDCTRDYADIEPARRAEMGPPIPLHVLVREQGSGRVMIDRVVNSQCAVSWGAGTITRTAAQIALPAGCYVMELRNLNSQAWMSGLRTTVSLGPGRMK